MPLLNGDEVRSFIDNNPDKERIVTLAALSALTRSASFTDLYTADSRWSEAIVLSAAGEEVAARLSVLGLPRSDLRLALFGYFWFQDPLIDTRTSNIELIEKIVEEEALKGQVRWPAYQGRVLYDRYHELFQEGHDSLRPPDVNRLLSGTGHGVYQVNRIITGPLGLLKSNHVRQFRPLMTMGLWHCPKIDCHSLHGVFLAPPRIPVTEAYSAISKSCTEIWQTPSRWETAVEIWPLPFDDSWRARSEMPIFLADCVTDKDRTALLSLALSGTNSDQLRQAIDAKKPKTAQGDASSVAKRLTTDEQLQILLILSDDEICILIDDLVLRREIDVPPTELREINPAKRALYFSLRTTPIQMCDLGVRRLRSHPILRLRHLILAAYSKTAETTDLDWRLRKPERTPTDHAVMEYMRRVNPLAAIESLVLSSLRVTSFVATALGSKIEATTERAAQLIAWKMGFELPRESRRMTTLTRVIASFAETCTKLGAPKADEDREAIRSAGVNVFVELEGFLEETIAYVVWLLYSDHPQDTHFTYYRPAAMQMVGAALGATLGSGDETLRWSANGNTLGTCVRYFQRLRNWIAELQRQDGTPLVRDPEDAHYLPSDAVRAFPFRHVALWKDVSPNALARLAKIIGDCSDHLNRAEVTYIRNGLEHYRDARRFPELARVLASIDLIRSFVHLAEQERLCAVPYWLESTQTDAFGQCEYILSDLRGNRVSIYSPRAVVGLLSLSTLQEGRPVLLAPGDLFGLPNSDILFTVKEQSTFSDYWQNYPARLASDLEQLSAPPPVDV